MKLRDIYKNINSPKISFEVFPPKDFESYQKLSDELLKLKIHNPAFISLTWGAGGTNNSSVDLIKKIISSGFDIMPHFTCVCSSKEFVKNHIDNLKDMNIDKILALRGDVPEEKNKICKDFCHANELVAFLNKNSDLSIGVAGYPEGHLESADIQEDIKYLKLKTDTGADAIFTQLFFDNDKFFKFTDIVRNTGIKVPIIPGIMPIISKKQIEKMLSLAKITVPHNLADKIEKFGKSNQDMQKMGVEYAVKQCENLIKEGVYGLHFFTLNKSKSVNEILENIL